MRILEVEGRKDWSELGDGFTFVNFEDGSLLFVDVGDEFILVELMNLPVDGELVESLEGFGFGFLEDVDHLLKSFGLLILKVDL